MKIYLDGSDYCVTADSFVNLQESAAVFVPPGDPRFAELAACGGDANALSEETRRGLHEAICAQPDARCQDQR